MSENNVILEEWIEVTQRPTIRQMDQINLVYKKYAREDIWEMELCVKIASVLLVDRDKAQEIESILEREIDEETAEKLTKWGEVLLPLITSFAEKAKKK